MNLRLSSLFIAFVVVLFALLSTGGAHAQDSTPRAGDDAGSAPKADNRARAQQLFDSALTDAEAGNFAAACPKFHASQEADPKTSTLLNLANCYEKNGQTASAWGAFREAEVLSRKAGRSDWETTARERAEALEPKLVRLTIDVPSSSRASGLVVTRDGVKLSAGEWGVAIPVDPGEHVVAASAPGRAAWEARTQVRDASATVAVPLLEELPQTDLVTPPVVPGEGAPIAQTSWWTPLRTAGVVVAGVGVVAIVTGSVLGLAADGQYDDARAQCSNGNRGCPAEAVRDSDSAYGLATGATVAWIVGGLAVASGGALVLLAPSSGSSEKSAIAAWLKVGPGSVGVAGRW
jgi:serine/threonine-protein kinase